MQYPTDFGCRYIALQGTNIPMWGKGKSSVFPPPYGWTPPNPPNPHRVYNSKERKRQDGLIIDSLKLTQHPKIGHPKRKLVFQPPICRCYVSLRESISLSPFYYIYFSILFFFIEISPIFCHKNPKCNIRIQHIYIYAYI